MFSNLINQRRAYVNNLHASDNIPLRAVGYNRLASVEIIDCRCCAAVYVERTAVNSNHMRVGRFNKVVFLSLIFVRVWQVNRYVAVGAIANYQLIPIRYGMRPVGIRYARVMFLQMPINITRAFGVF
jgi:hypothetical protein